MTIAFIDKHKEHYGVESSCAELPIGPSRYYEHKVRERNSKRLAERHQHDTQLLAEIRRAHSKRRERYGARKVWRQLQRESSSVARCSVEHLMRQAGLQGVSRGANKRRTTVPDDAVARLTDLVKRHFTLSRPDGLWVSEMVRS